MLTAPLPETGTMRDSTGRFITGNPGGPGNPHAGRVARLRARLLSAVGEGDIDDLVSAMLERARGGDIAAARLLLEYTIGKPASAPDPGGDAPGGGITFVIRREGDRPLSTC